ncbi:bifunctional 4-hydroxy-2-oxoglutarate aldolase/2-dehydro-3-deoxy-phosphogluconate aldolase [Olivibacter sp. SDN3]|uniref:bifunctional 4-hydroxy-2-oxoglutarate aldolase/2-dehydro-3-deoxy-phosphogluconate aldolase n=1 Tax=Olivibacter sp. SDN3 TaxID=2764720 RepID=UPI001651AA12|nr:bifunctional 4-hydroxy-2-oxoglutarate aldolase/2-dehydro-3-deoxy-phosphogluconate aldolase [Olivibacter sp. SDN3]QNL50921.1 bifunctional 4-hydroxy-2-oxoglutarate aldolase/2-dehydro-3-deoxy-phosphogluconate aldolase [Olivibacter sp. SDN3]
MTALEHLLTHRLICIIRGNFSEEAVLAIAKTLYQAGIRTLEITLNSPGALSFIEKLSDTYENRLLIGAGTVLSKKSVQEAVHAGAQFMLSPNVDVGVIETTKQLGKASIPGGFTATEIQFAHHVGGDIIKVFPARLGATYIADIQAPLPHIPLLPTGGVHLQNIADFHRAGAVGFGIGSSLVPSDFSTTDSNLHELELKARQYTDLLHKLGAK